MYKTPKRVFCYDGAMKLFLTGQPHSGKSTLINRLIQQVDNKRGFVTVEIPDQRNAGQRLGFDLQDSDGRTTTLAHVNNESEIRVSKYGVDVRALDDFIEPLFKTAEDTLLYIDEVGQMELYSKRFKELVRHYLNSTNNFIGTISSVYEDELIDEIKANPSIEIINITLENRDQLYHDLKRKI